MHTERTVRLASREGFTLIEVLVAMVILSVGLLGLEALGIGAARSLASAETKNELVAAATTAMEETQKEIRDATAAAPVVAGQTCETPTGSRLYICTTIQTSATAGVPARTARVTVAASKNGTSGNPFTVTSYVYDPLLP